MWPASSSTVEDSAPCTTPATAPPTGPGTITLPGPGTWTLAVWLTNAAGNTDPTLAAHTTISAAARMMDTPPSESAPGSVESDPLRSPSGISHAGPIPTRLRVTHVTKGRLPRCEHGDPL